MKKLLTYIIVFVIVGTGIISCNTDIEALDIVVPDKMSKEYWENLRAYKARNDHEVFFGWLLSLLTKFQMNLCLVKIMRLLLLKE